MAQSNHERIGKALELLNQALRPVVERALRAVYGDACIAVHLRIFWPAGLVLANPKRPVILESPDSPIRAADSSKRALQRSCLADRS
jgi:hypothetical protein